MVFIDKNNWKKNKAKINFRMLKSTPNISIYMKYSKLCEFVNKML